MSEQEKRILHFHAIFFQILDEIEKDFEIPNK